MPRDVTDHEKLRAPLRFRLSTREKEGLTALCNAHQLTESRMVRHLIRAAVGLPTAPDAAATSAIERAAEELGRIGVTINQAVRAMREGEASFAKELVDGLVLVSRMIVMLQQSHASILRAARERALSQLSQA